MDAVKPSKASASAGDRVFLRQATGLRRELSLWDAFNMDFSTAAPFVNIAVLVPLGLALFPGVDIPWAIGTGLVASLSIVFVYVLLARAIPRSGGDYVFISRILHPSLGFVASWTMFLLLAFFNGFSAFSIGAWLLPDLVGPLGVMTGNQGLIDLAGALSRPTSIVIIEAIELAILAVIMLRGVRFAAKFLWSSTIFIAVAFIVGLVVLLTTSNSAYVSNFNAFAAHFNTSADQMQALATKGGATLNPGFSISSIIAFWPLMLGITGYCIATVYVGGEVRNARQTQVAAIISAALATGAIMVLFAALMLRSIPTGLMNAMSYFAFVAPEKSPFPFALYGHVPIALAAGNPLFLILLTLAVGSGLWAATVTNYFWMTRYILAWSMDHMAPSQLAAVRGTNRAMVTAVIVVTVLSLAMGVALQYIPDFIVIAGYFPQVLLLGLASIAGILFPWRLKELYRASGQPTVAGLPLIVVAGVLSLIFLALASYFYVTKPEFGAITATSLKFFGFLVITGVVWYAVAWAIGRSRGYDLSLAQREIPPE